MSSLSNFKFRRRYTGPVRAVVLDWSGTIVDYGACGAVAALVELFRRQEVVLRPALARVNMGMSSRSHIETLLETDQIALQWENLRGCYPTSRDAYVLQRELIPLQMALAPACAEVIPGALAVLKDLRQRGIKVSTTSGNSSDVMRVVVEEASKQGIHTDVNISADQVPSGRPNPWMCLRAALEMQAFPLEACVKTGDTVPDIEEGLNAGMWTVGVARSGNEVGLRDDELAYLDDGERNARIIAAREKLSRGGAHFVIDTIAELPEILDEIQHRLAEGERP